MSLCSILRRARSSRLAAWKSSASCRRWDACKKTMSTRARERGGAQYEGGAELGVARDPMVAVRHQVTHTTTGTLVARTSICALSARACACSRRWRSRSLSMWSTYPRPCLRECRRRRKSNDKRAHLVNFGERENVAGHAFDPTLTEWTQWGIVTVPALQTNCTVHCAALLQVAVEVGTLIILPSTLLQLPLASLIRHNRHVGGMASKAAVCPPTGWFTWRMSAAVVCRWSAPLLPMMTRRAQHYASG